MYGKIGSYFSYRKCLCFVFYVSTANIVSIVRCQVSYEYENNVMQLYKDIWSEGKVNGALKTLPDCISIFNLSVKPNNTDLIYAWSVICVVLFDTALFRIAAVSFVCSIYHFTRHGSIKADECLSNRDCPTSCTTKMYSCCFICTK